MKKIVAAAVFLVACAAAFAQSVGDTAQVTFTRGGRRVTRTMQVASVTNYDRNGNTSSSAVRGSEFSPYDSYTGNTGNKSNATYDRQGRVTYEKDLVSGSIDEHWYDYDEARGYCVHEKTRRTVAEGRRAGAVQWEYEWWSEYDSRGNRTSQRSANGKVRRWEYDAQNNVTRQIESDGFEIRYEYNAKGLLVRTLKTDEENGGFFVAEENTYDANGFKIRSKTPLETISYEYDAHGNVTVQVSARDNSELYTYNEYTYWDNGKVKRCVTYIDATLPNWIE